MRSLATLNEPFLQSQNKRAHAVVIDRVGTLDRDVVLRLPIRAPARASLLVFDHPAVADVGDARQRVLLDEERTRPHEPRARASVRIVVECVDDVLMHLHAVGLPYQLLRYVVGATFGEVE